MSDERNGVSWPAMVAYVSNQTKTLGDLIARTSDALDRHEEWHRDAVDEVTRMRRAGRATWALVIVGSCSCVGSMILTIVDLVRR